MFVHQVVFVLKDPDFSADMTRILDNQVVPLLKLQRGFRDEILFVAPEETTAVAISLWATEETKDAYVRDQYPEILGLLRDLIYENPEVEAYEVYESESAKLERKVDRCPAKPSSARHAAPSAVNEPKGGDSVVDGHGVSAYPSSFDRRKRLIHDDPMSGSLMSALYSAADACRRCEAQMRAPEHPDAESLRKWLRELGDTISNAASHASNNRAVFDAVIDGKESSNNDRSDPF